MTDTDTRKWRNVWNNKIHFKRDSDTKISLWGCVRGTVALCHEVGLQAGEMRSCDQVNGSISGPGCAGFRRRFYSPAWSRLGYRSCPRDWLWWSPFPVHSEGSKVRTNALTRVTELRRWIIHGCRMPTSIIHGFVRFRTELVIMISWRRRQIATGSLK